MAKQMAKHPGGRFSIFPGKVDGVRIQGVLTKQGGRAFEQSRKALAKVFQLETGRKAPAISDADVVEYLARGEAATVEAIQAQEQQR
jgi:hypothetical protein